MKPIGGGRGQRTNLVNGAQRKKITQRVRPQPQKERAKETASVVSYLGVGLEDGGGLGGAGADDGGVEVVPPRPLGDALQEPHAEAEHRVEARDPILERGLVGIHHRHSHQSKRQDPQRVGDSASGQAQVQHLQSPDVRTRPGWLIRVATATLPCLIHNGLATLVSPTEAKEDEAGEREEETRKVDAKEERRGLRKEEMRKVDNKEEARVVRKEETRDRPRARSRWRQHRGPPLRPPPNRPPISPASR